MTQEEKEGAVLQFLCGGLSASLAHALHIPLCRLFRWYRGVEPIPTDLLDTALELLGEDREIFSFLCAQPVLNV